jgi:hypothetical protein
MTAFFSKVLDRLNAARQNDNLWYQAKPQDADFDVDQPRHTFTIRRICSLFFLVLIVMAEVACLVALPKRIPKSAAILTSGSSAKESSDLTTGASSTSRQARNCGDTAESAKERNCVFNIMTISWETPECYHEDIVDDFLQRRDWHFYNDTAKKEIPSWDEVGLATRRYHVPWDFHFTHCTYVWKMMQKAVVERLPLPDNVLSSEHTRHCMDVWLDRRWKFEEMHTFVHVKWPQCQAYGTWSQANYTEG